MFCSSCKKVSVSFIIISSIAAATRITINKIITKLFNFLRVSLKRNNVGSLHGDWKTTLRRQKVKLLCTDLANLDLTCNDFFPINGSTHTNSFLGARAYSCLSMGILFKTLLLQTSIELQ